ncbi:Hypothetical predicted protein [Lecanosticta acicola]|uniref:Uncharacterized protein n=1 Tax=Lecanosticta acicola TaxID=111012 RepID=A0AAI9EBC5_9PEZI|nr:Hypothetical predicted protein [Lecanosticta acicola]
MNFSPYTWRADDGYLPPPGSMPGPPTGYTPIYCPWYFPGQQGPAYSYFPPPPPYPGAPVAAYPPPPPPKPASAKKSDPPAPPKPKIEKCILELKSVAPGESNTGGGSKSAKSSDHNKPNSNACGPPPSLRPGMNYMFSKEHTMLHIFNKASKGIFEGKYKGLQLPFKIFKVSTSFTVRDVIEKVVGKSGGGEGECKGWAATEVVEVGCGEWFKGTTIEYDSDKAKGTLGSMGWGPKRGKALPPVWLVVHKA